MKNIFIKYILTSSKMNKKMVWFEYRIKFGVIIKDEENRHLFRFHLHKSYKNFNNRIHLLHPFSVI